MYVRVKDGRLTERLGIAEAGLYGWQDSFYMDGWIDDSLACSWLANIITLFWTINRRFSQRLYVNFCLEGH